MDVAEDQAGELARTQAGLDRDREQGMVAPPGPGRAVRGGEQCFDLGPGEVADQRAVEAFGRDREHPLDDGGVFGVVEGGVAEQRADSCQPGVSGPHAVAPVELEVVQERTDQRRVQVGDLQARRCLARPLFGEGQEQLERVPVGGDGVRAGLALPGQAVGEEALQGRGKGAHGRSPLRISSRFPARAISSGEDDKYQLFRSRNNWYYSDSRVIPIPASLCV